MSNFETQLLSYSRILRHEYFIGLWIGCFATLILWYRPDVSPPISTVLLTLLFSGIFYLCGFLANSIWDAELEIAYLNEKHELAQGVYRTGKQRLLSLLIIGLGVSLLLSIWLSTLLASFVPVFLFFLGCLLGIGYSAPPVRWKERGFLLHALSLGISAFLLPVLLLVGVLNNGFTWQILLLAIGYACTQYGLEIGNQMKDYEYDKVRGIMTLPLDSLRVSGAIGLLLLLVGNTIVVVMLAAIFELPLKLIIIIAALELIFHFGAIISYTRAMLKKDKHHIQRAFLNLNYSGWQTQSMLGLLIISILVRLSD